MKVLDSYKIPCDGLDANVRIVWEKGDFVPHYKITIPIIEKGTVVILDDIKQRLTLQLPIKAEGFSNAQEYEAVVENFKEKAKGMLNKLLPKLDENTKKYLAFTLVSEMLGLGRIEILFRDADIEEIVVNSSTEPIWVYHKRFGWLKTNLIVNDEKQIENYAKMIGRRIGRTINILNPLMDAHLMTGDRVNATLFPISTRGNTITIRKFRRNPFTILDLISNKTLSPETAALIWEAIHYEVSLIVSGGTASGKTTFLNAILEFVPPNQRIVSIEDTRELNLPRYLHWIPLTTREPNQEGKGQVTMLDLLVNSLRMRPDRIVVGEIRRQREAEVLFEALHTGHSVYATLHANTAEDTVKRMTSPPIDLPVEEVEDIPLVSVMFRNRRLGIRRLFQVSEILNELKVNTLYQWEPREDKIEKKNEFKRFDDLIELYSGLSKKEIEGEIKEKANILKKMIKNNVTGIDEVGKLVSLYYVDKSELLKVLK